jgi:hypothetical protein
VKEEDARENVVMDDDVMSNAAYYRNRERSERDLADRAPAEDIREIHRQLARRYGELADELDGRERAGG